MGKRAKSSKYSAGSGNLTRTISQDCSAWLTCPQVWDSMPSQKGYVGGSWRERLAKFGLLSAWPGRCEKWEKSKRLRFRRGKHLNSTLLTKNYRSFYDSEQIPCGRCTRTGLKQPEFGRAYRAARRALACHGTISCWRATSPIDFRSGEARFVLWFF